jgi:hypothetical protein
MCALVGVSAPAAERSKILVVPFVARDAATDEAATTFTQLANDELKARTDTVDFIAAPQVKGTPAPAVRRGPTPEVMAALHSGTKAFDELRFDDAIRDLRRGIDGLLSDPATADFAALHEANVKLAASYFRAGAEKEAKAALIDLARLSPTAVLPSGFPPVFQRELEKARKRLEKAPHGQISVEGPSGSTAFIDGRDVGLVPALDENLAAGLHYLRVEGSRGERWGQAVEVKAGVTKVRALFMNSTADRAPVNIAFDPRISSPVDDPMVARLQAYTKAAGADFALFGVVLRLNDTQLQASGALYSLKRNAVSLLTPVAFDSAVLTANTEVFNLGDEAIRRAISFGIATALPIDLMLHKAQSAAAVAPPALTPRPRPLPPSALVPGPTQATVAAPDVKTGVPAWVWVVTGIVAAGGAAVGGYFVVSNVTRPVTGTVNATW